jgi:hypothetical protein
MPKKDNILLSKEKLSEKRFTPQTNNGTDMNSAIPTLGK